MSKQLGAPLDELLSELVKIPSTSSDILVFMNKLAASGIDRASVDDMLRLAAPRLGTTLADLQEKYEFAQERIGYWSRYREGSAGAHDLASANATESGQKVTNLFDALFTEAAELDVHDRPRLELFVRKLAFSDLPRSVADSVLRQIPLKPGPRLPELLAKLQRAPSEAEAKQLRWEIRCEKSPWPNLTLLRDLYADARLRIKNEKFRAKLAKIEESEKPRIYLEDFDPWTPVLLSSCRAQWVVICCPFCGKQHYHGAPKKRQRRGDVGSRACHCKVGRFRGEYRLWWDGVSIEPDRKPRRGKQGAPGNGVSST